MNMKTTRFFIPLMLICAALSFHGCTESCADVSCQNGGTCSDGTCSCPTGFTGELCETPTDPCANVDCGDEGICDEGVCVCNEGITGTNCEIEQRAQYYGVYSGTLTGPDGTSTVLVTISEYLNYLTNLKLIHPGESDLRLGVDLTSGVFTIPGQTIYSNGYRTYEGSGNFNGDELSYSFSVIFTEEGGFVYQHQYSFTGTR